MTPAPKGLVSVLIFGNENFPVLPAPFQCMIHTTLKGAEDYLTRVNVDVIYVGVSVNEPDLTANLTRLAKLAPGVSLIALVKDLALSELAFSNGAADCILTDQLTPDTAVQSARFAIARGRYMKHGGGNHLYTYSDLAAIARVLSHDIRNSLSGIMLSIEPIRQAITGNDDAKSYIDILDRSAVKLNQVVNRFSLATGNIALKTSEEEFNDVIHHSVAAISPSSLKDAKLIETYDDRQLRMQFDKEKFPQAIMNLLMNAIDAVEGYPNGEVRITTVVTDEYAEVTISDNGQGIDYTTLQNIFRPFFTTRPGRTGLGLPIAYSILNAHGGTLRIESSNGSGTVVTCRFPVKK